MDRIIEGHNNVYGYDIGILILDSSFPRIKGDIGNAITWRFPVLYKKVIGQTSHKVVLELNKNDIYPFIMAAKELEKEGVKAITTSCGFLALFQEELAKEINIPIYTSALMLVPMVSRMIGKNMKVGILTANKATLTKEHLMSVGINEEYCVIEGLEDKQEFTNFTIQNRNQVNIDLCIRELVSSTKSLMKREKKIGAIVLECTNMPPFAEYIQKEAGVPVFDIVSLTNMVYESFHKEKFLKDF